MGIPFSNSEEAAMLFVRKNRWNGIDLVPLMNSRSVVEHLENGLIEYGVVASSNIIAGPVSETVESLSGRENIEVQQTIDVPIHHCLFVKREGNKIDTIASHPQALMQTSKNLEKLFPDTKRIEVEDTAYAAEMLFEGLLPDNVGVVCRKDAGENYDLFLMYENIEDDPQNTTTFSLIRLK